MGLSKPCQSYSSVWANAAARTENSSSSWSIFSRRRISSAAISSPALGATPPTPLCILKSYEQTFGESRKFSVNFGGSHSGGHMASGPAPTPFSQSCRQLLGADLDPYAMRHHADLDAPAVDREVQPMPTEMQAVDFDAPPQPGFDRRDFQPAARRVGLEPQQRVDHLKRGCGAPVLRAAAGLVILWNLAHDAFCTGEQLRQPPIRVRHPRFERGSRHHLGLGGKSRKPEARGRDRVVVRPNRAVVIAPRVVVDRLRRQSADPPSGEQLRRDQTLRDGVRAGGRQDSGPQTMTRVGGDGFHALPAAVERLRDEPLARHPEIAVEVARELGGSRLQLRTLARESFQRPIEVSLDLAKRGRPKDVSPVHVSKRVVRILPAFVARLNPDSVFEIAVAVLVAVRIAPRERRLGCRPQLVEQRSVARPLERFGEDGEKEWGRVDSPIEDVRPQPSLDRLAVPDLVQDLARLLFGPRINALALVLGQEPQGAPCDIRVHRQCERRSK